jgi:hypothetical protein
LRLLPTSLSTKKEKKKKDTNSRKRVKRKKKTPKASASQSTSPLCVCLFVRFSKEICQYDKEGKKNSNKSKEKHHCEEEVKHIRKNKR